MNLFTDASGALGFGAFFNGHWCNEAWYDSWLTAGLNRNMVLLALFPVVVAVHLWGELFRNKRILLNTDNMGVMFSINCLTSNCEVVVKLLRYLSFLCFKYNIWLKAKHIYGKTNEIADALSRSQWSRFRDLAPQADQSGYQCPEELWRIIGLVSRLWRNSVSVNTWSGYMQAWSKWCVFCGEVNAGCFKADLGLAMTFVCSSINDQLSALSIKKLLAGVSFFLKLNGGVSLISFFQVNQLLKGYSRSSVVGKRKRPITGNVLVMLCNSAESVCTSDYEVLLFKAAFVLTFSAALRISELVAANKSVANLEQSDVVVREDLVQVFVRSKTDTFSKGVVLSLNALPGSVLCPLVNVKGFLDVRPGVPGSFFIHSDSSPLTRFQFRSVLTP